MLETITDLNSVPVLLDPHEKLSQLCAEVTNIEEEERLTLGRMWATLHQSGQGLAIAAPQIGETKQLVVVDLAKPAFQDYWDDLGGDPLLMVNPRIVRSHGRQIVFDHNGGEGCLSIPGLRVVTDTRYGEVTVAYADETGQEYRRQFTGLLAVVLQHEIDHLHGIMLWTRMRDPKLVMEAQAKRIAFQLAALTGVLPLDDAAALPRYAMLNQYGDAVVARLIEASTSAEGMPAGDVEVFPTAARHRIGALMSDRGGRQE